jgi:periplasmic divalent cation tolerance protein
VKVVLSTAPAEAARNLASKLVEERLAACVNILPGVVSVYRWEGRIETSDEVLLVAKTSDAAAGALVARLAEIHPYSVPEIVALDAARVHPKYLEWVDSETSSGRFRAQPSKESASGDDVVSEHGTSPCGVTDSSCMEGQMAAKKKPAKKAATKPAAKKTAKKKK